jgi:hypothetical protein
METPAPAFTLGSKIIGQRKRADEGVGRGPGGPPHNVAKRKQLHGCGKVLGLLVTNKLKHVPQAAFAVSCVFQVS